eukprot:64472_1
MKTISLVPSLILIIFQLCLAKPGETISTSLIQQLPPSRLGSALAYLPIDALINHYLTANVSKHFRDSVSNAIIQQIDFVNIYQCMRLNYAFYIEQTRNTSDSIISIQHGALLKHKIQIRTPHAIQRHVDARHGQYYTNTLSLSNQAYLKHRNGMLRSLGIHFQIKIHDSVETLQLKHNRLTSMDAFVFGNASNLTEIDVSHNDFTQLNYDTFGKYVWHIKEFELRVLTVDKNPITGMIDLDVLNARRLYQLSITRCPNITRITQVPDTLKSIDVRRSGISSAEQVRFIPDALVYGLPVGIIVERNLNATDIENWSNGAGSFVLRFQDL